MVGISESGLRVFIDRASIVRSGALREATVRMGSPRTIVGRIVEVHQREQFDCRRRRWRLIRFRAFDAAGATVAATKPGSPVNPAIPIASGSISSTVFEQVCA